MRGGLKLCANIVRTTAHMRMHPSVVAALSSSNGVSAVKKLAANGLATPRDRNDAATVVQIRVAMAQAGPHMGRQDRALRKIQNRLGLSNTRLKRLCKLSKVCIADGQWYADLDKRLHDDNYRVKRSKIKDDYELLKFCMLHAAHRSAVSKPLPAHPTTLLRPRREL